MNQELKANTALSHYRILSKIGAGGMGEVYLAQDTTPDRKVAFKLPAKSQRSNIGTSSSRCLEEVMLLTPESTSK